jgi:hypothetical protein
MFDDELLSEGLTPHLVIASHADGRTATSRSGRKCSTFWTQRYRPPPVGQIPLDADLVQQGSVAAILSTGVFFHRAHVVIKALLCQGHGIPSMNVLQVIITDLVKL